ncbi:MAG: excinuclease ABC subunit UvrC, partial [Acinetobacter sp.]
IRFLQGDTKELNQELIAKMEAAAEALEFEKAVFYRDRMALLRDVQSQQAIYKLKGEADILAIAYHAGVTCVQIMHVRNGKMLGGKSYFPDMQGDDLGQMLSDFMANFYFQVADEVPAELIVNVEIPDRKELEQALQQEFGKKVQIKHNVRETRAEWLELANMNVQHAIKGQLANHFELNERFHQLEQVVGRPIDRIECFDISHTMGEATVASCVVFDSGGARKRDYRQFSIDDITGGDDYAAMRQALTRRYKKAMLPDLLLIDGGKGQLHMAMQVMQDLGLDAFMVGVSKGEGRKPGLETLHFTDGTKIQLPEDHKALHLIQQVRDEAHRFAITKHRAKRDKKRGSSVLEVIPGLGPKRRRDLLTHFGGIQGVLKASENDLKLVPGLGDVMARTIYKILHE